MDSKIVVEKRRKRRKEEKEDLEKKMLQQSEIDSRYANLLLTMKESKLYWKVKNQLIQEILEKFNDMS